MTILKFMMLLCSCGITMLGFMPQQPLGTSDQATILQFDPPCGIRSEASYGRLRLNAETLSEKLRSLSCNTVANVVDRANHALERQGYTIEGSPIFFINTTVDHSLPWAIHPRYAPVEERFIEYRAYKRSNPDLGVAVVINLLNPEAELIFQETNADERLITLEPLTIPVIGNTARARCRECDVYKTIFQPPFHNVQKVIRNFQEAPRWSQNR